MSLGSLRKDLLEEGQAERAASIWAIFGSPDDPMEELERRAREVLPNLDVILWEGDPQTFQFSYVSDSASDVLGYEVRRWTEDPCFWTEHVVHPHDREEAVAFCALATGKKEDHDFEYRAITEDGRVRWLHDVVRVVIGEKGVPVLLHGIMIDVTDLRRSNRSL